MTETTVPTYSRAEPERRWNPASCRNRDTRWVVPEDFWDASSEEGISDTHIELGRTSATIGVVRSKP
jgi:hypothetical protein